MSTPELLFTFPDGMLRYDCSSCTEKLCCHGSGINLSVKGRGNKLLHSYPNLHLQIIPQVGDMLFLPVLPSGCRFLQNGECLLHGSECYPAYCELYPFTLLAISGTTIIVAPDPRCKTHPAPDGSGVKHSDLITLFERLDSCSIPVVPNRTSDLLPKERLLRDTAGECLLNGDSLGSLLAFCHVVDHHNREELTTLDINSEMAAYQATLEDILPRWLKLLRLDNLKAEPEPILEEQLIINLVTQRIFGRWEDALTFATAYAGLASYLFRLPKELQARATPQDICQYFSSLEPFLWHLTNWAKKPQIAAPEALSGFEEYQELFADAAWGDILIESTKEMGTAESMVKLRLIYEDLRGVLSWK